MIELNYPEGGTPLDPNEIEGLLLDHITTIEELNRWEQENIQSAISWLTQRRSSEILNEEFICLLHEKMYGKVWQWAGSYRKTEKSIGVNHYKIPNELRSLLNDIQYWIENKTYSQDEIAYRFHHKLVLIHLFPNGNGRHARLMTEILQEEILGQKPFTWGAEDLNKATQSRKKYIAALKAADNHDFTLIAGFVRS